MSQKNGKSVAEIKSDSLTPKGILIAIGGKEDKGSDGNHIHDRNEQFIELEILERFTKELKGKNPLIVIIPTASSEPEKAAKDYLKLIKEAAGIIFTGGDQLKLTSNLGGTDFLTTLKQQYQKEPIIIAGTSAGAAAMSSGMIYEGQKDNGMFKGDVRSTSGLEFIKNVAIDTHFIARGRMIRMANRLASNPGCLGIGLEEDTGLVITAGREAEVIGSGLIMLMDARGCTSTNIHEIDNGEPVTLRNLKVDLLGKGDTFSIPDYN